MKEEDNNNHSYILFFYWTFPLLEKCQIIQLFRKEKFLKVTKKFWILKLGEVKNFDDLMKFCWYLRSYKNRTVYTWIRIFIPVDNQSEFLKIFKLVYRSNDTYAQSHAVLIRLDLSRKWFIHKYIVYVKCIFQFLEMHPFSLKRTGRQSTLNLTNNLQTVWEIYRLTQ